MREILFKAQRADTREWVEGYLWSKRTIGYTSPCGNTDEIVIDPETVCQYTGIDDIRKNKVYEKDKVVFDKGTEFQERGIVYFKDGFFIAQCETGWRFLHFSKGEVEVEGNIHDKGNNA